MADPLPPSDAALADELFTEITASWKSQAIAVAAHLGLADLMREDAKSVQELAAQTQTDPSSLERLLKALATLGICKSDGRSFSLTPKGCLLRTNTPASLRHWAIWWGMHLGPVWQQLLYSIQTGKSARTLLTGKNGFEHLETDLNTAAIFNQAMAQLCRMVHGSLLRSYDFHGIRTLIDVGGGVGETLTAILMEHPEMSGVLIDLPHARKACEARLDQLQLAARCKFSAADFFESIEPGADAYLLKSVLHDWNDEQSLQILANCRRAIRAGGRLLLIEQMLPDQLAPNAYHQSLMRSDLNMLVALRGAERTESELRRLLETSGFLTVRVIPLEGTFTLLEARPSSGSH